LPQDKTGIDPGADSGATKLPIDQQDRESVLRIFERWGSSEADNFSVFDRLLVSIVMLDYSQRGGAEAIAGHLETISPEMQRAMIAQADRLLTAQAAADAAAMQERDVGSLWLKAVEYGIQGQLDEFSRSQVATMNELKVYVEKKTSIRTQLAVGMLVSFALGVAINWGQGVQTIFDRF